MTITPFLNFSLCLSEAKHRAQIPPPPPSSRIRDAFRIAIIATSVVSLAFIVSLPKNDYSGNFDKQIEKKDA